MTAASQPMSDNSEAEGADQVRPIVLVVDDSRMQRRILGASLTQMGYDVVEAASGEEALAMCQERHFELVLSDWMMPGMDGLEFCQEFRKLDRDEYGYFILLTSKSERSEIARGLEVGADDFLTKPVNGTELRARITAGERIVAMQRQLTEKNRLLSSAFERIQSLYDAIDADLSEAKRLQQSLVRERFRDLGPAHVSLLLRSAGHVGGDLVGFFPTGTSTVGIYSIDVSGHGITSALLTARLAGYLSSSSRDQNIALNQTGAESYELVSTDRVVQRLNDLMFEDIETEHYFTIALGLVDLDTGKVQLTQAGHPHPMVQRQDGSIEFVGEGDLPVGLFAGASYASFEIQLNPGDRLLLCSDGVTECPLGEETDHMLEESGLDMLIHKNSDLRGPRMLEAIVWDLTEIYGQDDLPDDVSGVLFEYFGPDRTPSETPPYPD